MSKSKNEKRISDGQAMAKSKAIRTGARKLNMIAASIRGMNVQKALTQLSFEKRRVSNEVKAVLQSAVANAENNHSLDVDRLYVAEAWTGRAFVMKRWRARARGRSAGIQKPFSNLTIIVEERAEEPKPKAKKTAPKKEAAPKAEAKKETKKAAPKKAAAKKTTTKKSTKKAAEAAAGA